MKNCETILKSISFRSKKLLILFCACSLNSLDLMLRGSLNSVLRALAPNDEARFEALWKPNEKRGSILKQAEVSGEKRLTFSLTNPAVRTACCC